MSFRPAVDPAVVLMHSGHRPALKPRHALWALAGAAVVAVVLLVTLPSGGGSEPSRPATYTAPGGSFSLTYPAGWHATAAGSSAVVIARSDRRALVTVRRNPPLRGSLAGLVSDLPGQLAKRFADFRPLGARAVRLSTGPAVAYTFTRTRANTVETMVVAPTRSGSFTLVAVARGGATEAAREAGTIVRSLQAR